MTLNTARVAYIQLCECPCVAQPGIKPNQIFLEKPENVRLPPSNLTELERRRITNDCQMLMCKSCRIKPKKT